MFARFDASILASEAMQDNYRAQAQFLVQYAPPLTVESSPLFSEYVVRLSNYDTNVSLDTVFPYFLRKLQCLEGNYTATLALATPVDQTITCALAQIHGTPFNQPETFKSTDQMLEHFKFMIQQIHCLDHLEFLRRVISNLNELVLGYELMVWNRLEEETLLDVSYTAEDSYSDTYLRKMDEGKVLNSVLDAAGLAVHRLSEMAGSLGEQYTKEMIAIINQRPQHVVGQYDIAHYDFE